MKFLTLTYQLLKKVTDVNCKALFFYICTYLIVPSRQKFNNLEGQLWLNSLLSQNSACGTCLNNIEPNLDAVLYRDFPTYFYNFNLIKNFISYNNNYNKIIIFQFNIT